jgi:hypothetical protein
MRSMSAATYMAHDVLPSALDVMLSALNTALLNVYVCHTHSLVHRQPVSVYM